jgi:DNA-binding transcriptional regulator YiaG
MDAIADEIRRLRQELGMTLAEFGAHVGVPWQSIAAYETGRRIPPGDRLLVIIHRSRRASKPFRLPVVARAVDKATRAAA